MTFPHTTPLNEISTNTSLSAVYVYRTTENPDALLTMITQGKTLDEAYRILENKYGDRLISVETML